MNLRLSSLLLHALVLAPAGLLAQPASPSCVPTAVPATVRAEGITERVGDIQISCVAAPNLDITGNLSIFLSTTVTNRLLSDSGTLDVGLSVNGAMASAPATLGSATQITFAGLRIVFNSAGRAELRLTGIRANATAALGSASSAFPQPIVAQISYTPATGLAAVNATLQVAAPERGLYATSTPTVVPSHSGSPIPETISFSELIRIGTMFASTRVTEGFATAFEPPAAGTIRGTRIMLRLSGFPPDARLFVPNGIAGSSAAVPTSAGDFGSAVSGGAYAPGSGTLYLARVAGADQSGNGGSSLPVETTINGASEVFLSGGSGVAVFEVRDASPTARELAQIPVFMGVPQSVSARSVNAGVEVMFAPVSANFTASTTDPVPRFVGVKAPSDCTSFGDCDAYIPRLTVFPGRLDYTLRQGTSAQYRVISVSNAGGGSLFWSARVEYQNGANWVVLDRDSGDRAGSTAVVVTALPTMQPGKYAAAVVIDAGAAGLARVPIQLGVLERPAQPPPVTPVRPSISEVLHGATFENVPVAIGSFATIKGTHLGGKSVAVTFDGRPAKLLYTSDTQINLQVPSDLPGNTSLVVVTADGTASDAKTVQIVSAYPGIFTPGILNQDGSVNAATNPANAGSYVQIYATGLLAPDGSGVVEARLHDLTLTSLPYAGPAPGIPGLQQVNLQIPEYYPTMTTEVLLCTTSGGQRRCSTPVKIHIRQVQ